MKADARLELLKKHKLKVDSDKMIFIIEKENYLFNKYFKTLVNTGNII